jgi:hypothetical protein
MGCDMLKLALTFVRGLLSLVLAAAIVVLLLNATVANALLRRIRILRERISAYLRYEKSEDRQATIYNLDVLTHLTLSAYDMPEVAIADYRPPTVNVLVPAFDFASMSAGFFGVFQVALYIKRCGLNVRLVMYQRFDFDPKKTREKLVHYPGMEHLLDELEFEYVGNRDRPLLISRHDNCVATVWYSAYMARKIMETRGAGKFLYLIQDYEAAFHPSGSQFALAENSYSFDYCALFSSKALQDLFLKRRIGIFGDKGTDYIYFNNACSSVLPAWDDFTAARRGKKKRLAFYSRPPVDRNMFELGALALCMAVREGVFPTDEWEFIGIGLGDAVIRLDGATEMKQMPRMNLREYQEIITTFDIGFCLMASSHPSLLPFDLSGSGAVVVTNAFGVKDQAYFDAVTRGVIVCEPDAPALVEGLRKAVAVADDLDVRYANARAMTFPTSWAETFNDRHEAFMRAVFRDTLQAWNEAEMVLACKKESRVRELNALPVLDPVSLSDNASSDYAEGSYRRMLWEHYNSTSWRITRPVRNLVRRLEGLPPERIVMPPSDQAALREIERLRHSTSWEVTAPLRAIGNTIRGKRVKTKKRPPLARACVSGMDEQQGIYIG